MAVEVEKLIVTLEARLNGYNRGLQQAQTDTDKKLAAMEARFQAMSSRLKASASSAAMGVGGALAGLGALLSIDRVLEYADAWTRVRRALEQNEKIFGVQLRSAEELNVIASDTRQNLESISKLYIRTSNAVQEMGRSNDDAAMAVESFAKALVIGQASANEQRGALEQFSQALQKGKLDGDEFRTIMETAGVVQEALAKQFDVSRGSLLAMARTGKLTGKDIVEALIKIKPIIDEAFKSAPTTVGEGLTILNNAITQYIGKLNEATRATAGIGYALKAAALNMDTVAGVALSLAAALLAPFSGRATGAIAAFAARLLTVPGAIAGSIVAVETLGKQVNLNIRDFSRWTEAGFSAGDALRLSMNEATASATTLQDQFHGLVQVLSEDMLSAINTITDALSGFSVTWSDIAGAAVVAIGTTVAALKSLVAGLSGAWESVPLAADVAFKKIYNSVAEWMQSIVDAFATGINAIIAVANKIPKVDIDYVVAPEIGKYDQSGIDESLRRLGKIADETREKVRKAYDLKDLAGRTQDAAKMNALARVIDGYGMDKAPRGKPEGPRKRYEEEDKGKRSEFEREVAQINKRTAALKAELETINQSVFAQERAKAAAELRSALDETVRKRGTAATKEEIAAIGKLSETYAAAQTQAAMLQAIKAKRDGIDALNDEIALMGLFGSALTEAKIKQELLNEAKRLGVALTADQVTAIEATARQTAETQAYRDAILEVQDASKEMLSSFVSDMRNGVSATEALGNALGRLADRLIDSGIDKLISSLLSGATGSGGSILDIFKFAGGGIAASGRPVSLPTFAGGGVSKSAAIFGEAGPEAAVPLPDGRRIPVDLRMPKMPAAVSAQSAGFTTSNITVAPVFNVQNGTPEGVEKLKAEIPGLIVKTMNEAFDRSPRFKKARI